MAEAKTLSKTPLFRTVADVDAYLAKLPMAERKTLNLFDPDTYDSPLFDESPTAASMYLEGWIRQVGLCSLC